MSRTWFNGSLVEGPLALDRGDRGLLLGDGLFETILVLNRTPLWGNMHFARLEAAAKELGLGFDRDALDDALSDFSTMRRRATRCCASPSPAAAPRGPRRRWRHAQPAPDARSLRPRADVQAGGAVLHRDPPQPAASPPPQDALLHRQHRRRARGRRHGAEDALMLNIEGHVACTTIANIFLLKGERSSPRRATRASSPASCARR